MPFIKREDLEVLLKSYFMAGVTFGYGFDHDESLVEQEEKAYEEYRKRQKELGLLNT